MKASHFMPKPKDFAVNDHTVAAVNMRSAFVEPWGEQWIAGATAGQLGSGNAHGFHVPFELAIGSDEPGTFAGRIIDALPAQKLPLEVREHNGNDRDLKEGEPEPESCSIVNSIAEGPMTGE